MDSCPNCGVTNGKKLSKDNLNRLAYRFFVKGSFQRTEYGGAPLIQFNEHQQTSIYVPSGLASDIKLFERLLCIGFFDYGPRLCMIGYIEPLEELLHHGTQRKIIDRILHEYPERKIGKDAYFYRIRKKPTNPEEPLEYDSPPNAIRESGGRLDSDHLPVLYASPDLQTCIHECRITAEDELFVACLTPNTDLRVLDLSILLDETDVTEFESLDLAVYMLFLAGEHSYEITRKISIAASNAGFHGVIFPSYFGYLRLGCNPFETTYGLMNRWIPHPYYRNQELNKVIPNIAIFGRPIADGVLSVKCINRLVITGVNYNFHFGPIV